MYDDLRPGTLICDSLPTSTANYAMNYTGRCPICTMMGSFLPHAILPALSRITLQMSPEVGSFQLLRDADNARAPSYRGWMTAIRQSSSGLIGRALHLLPLLPLSLSQPQ